MNANTAKNIPEDVLQRATNIRLLLLDVDGVLTDGKLYYDEHGNEQKTFDIQDGLGVKMLQRNDIQVGIITGRTSNLLSRRADEMGIELVVQGREDKLTALEEILATEPWPMEQIAFMGDDLPDLAVIRRVGLGVTPANGNHFIAQHAHWQTSASGGRGAVRELAELILAAQDKLDNTLAAYL